MLERTADYPVDPIFLERWSPRAYDGNSMPHADLLSILEAARWAPSAYNIQPWRFLYAQRDDAIWQKYVGFLDEGNASWAQHAAALVLLLSDSLTPAYKDQPARPSGTHSFDAGAAWAQLALQATSLGYKAHAVAGIERDKIREELQVPEQYKIEIAVALGRHGRPENLPEELQSRELPSDRYRLQELAFAGGFPQ